METQVQQFLLKLPEEKRQLTLFVRDIVLSVNAEIIEEIKWRNLTFTYRKKSFSFIYTYRNTDYINVAFFYAVQLTDAKKLFEGTGKGMRHLKVRTMKDVPVTQLKKWVKESLVLLNETSASK